MTLQIALLHLAPIAADVAHNRRLVEAAVAAAAGAGAEWSLVVSGGRRLLSFRAERSAACIVEWDPVARRLAAEIPRRIDL